MSATSNASSNVSTPATTPAPSTPSTPSGNYVASPEVEKAIKYITNFKNPFDIFDLNEDASMEDIQKKYKRVALLIHPDKCKHPKATEAFSSK